MILLLLLTVACAPADDPWSSGLGAVDDTGEDPAEDPVDWLTPHWAETVEICDPPDPFALGSVFAGLNVMNEACHRTGLPRTWASTSPSTTICAPGSI